MTVLRGGSSQGFQKVSVPSRLYSFRTSRRRGLVLVSIWRDRRRGYTRTLVHRFRLLLPPQGYQTTSAWTKRDPAAGKRMGFAGGVGVALKAAGFDNLETSVSMPNSTTRVSRLRKHSEFDLSYKGKGSRTGTRRVSHSVQSCHDFLHRICLLNPMCHCQVQSSYSLPTYAQPTATAILARPLASVSFYFTFVLSIFLSPQYNLAYSTMGHLSAIAPYDQQKL